MVEDIHVSPLLEDEEHDETVVIEAADPSEKKGKRRGLFGRIFKRRKRDEIIEDEVAFDATETSLNETEVPLVEDLPPPPLTWRESVFGKTVEVPAVGVIPSTGAFAASVNEALPFGVEDLDLPPIVQASLPGAARGGITLAAASIPLALVVCMLVVRATWYFYEHRNKLTSEAAESGQTTSRQTNGNSKSLSNGNGNHKGSTRRGSKGHGHSNGHTVAKTPEMSEENERELKRTLEREATAKQRLAQENQALQEALDMHKSSVDKFSLELQSRNERLSVFEQEQESVRRQLSSQIEVLKQELQERQKQEQGNLKSKESLCNDLITKIKALNQDLENHEKLWQGVAQKAEKKEVESAAKVETLERSLKVEEEQRTAAIKAKEAACTDLTNKMKTLQAQQAKQVSINTTLEQRMGAGVFPAVEEKLRARLKEEQDHSSSLTTKLQVFSAELMSREERVSTLDAKMKEVERLSASELKELQQELQDQVVQREKLQQAAVEMTRLLQEKQNQCVRLQTQWASSKEELKALDDRVDTLTNEVQKRETTAAERIESLKEQLGVERKQVQACEKTFETTNEELIKTQEEFVQLTTRMDLFLKELQFRDEQVASLESKLTSKEDLATSEIKILQAQLEEVTEHRDTWNKTTGDLTQLMKDKKAQVVGLTTRADLFELELTNRQEGVDALEAKIRERYAAEAVKMEPYRKELHRLEQERDSWSEKTDEIGRLLKQRIAQSEGLTTRLKLFRIELAKRDERVSTLKTTYKGKKQSAHMDVAPVRVKLEQQREQRDAWTAKTEDIDRTLKEKRAQSVGLRTRVHLFGRELETKEQLLAQLEIIVNDKKEAGDAVLANLRRKLPLAIKARDEWKASTEKVIQLLADRKGEAADLTAELKGLVGDLQSYQHRRAKLEAQIVQQRALVGGRRGALEEELKAVLNHRDEWANKTKDVMDALKATEQSIVGLETRAFLFEKELGQRGEALNKFQKEYRATERKSFMKMEQLRGAINAEKNLHEHGVETTVKLNKELKDTKRECVGLSTRSELFRRELQKREDLVAEQEKKIGEVESDSSVMVGRLRHALAEQEKARDEWNQKTDEVNRLQMQNDEEIVSLGTRLEVFMARVMSEEENVARAANKARSQRGTFGTKDLDAAKETRDEWTVKALDIEKELRTRKSQVSGLQTRKMLFRVELEKLEKQVSELKWKVTQKEKSTAAKVAPLKEALKGLLRQRDDWIANLEGIDKMLNEKHRQCLPISRRLEEVIDQLTQCTDRIANLEGQLQEEESFVQDNVMGLKIRLDQQKNELSGWKQSTADVNSLLQEKKQGTEGLKTRLVVFGQELRKRQAVVMDVASKIKANDKALADVLELINAQIEAEHLKRDRIIETTLSQNKALKAMEDTCVAMVVRRKLFEEELRTREEQARLLEAKLKEKEYDHGAEMKRLKTELAAKRSDWCKWRDSTQSMDTLMKETEGECVGLATRSLLFNVEKEKYEKQVAELEETVTRKETDSAEKIAPIHDQLQQEQLARDSWDKKTVELNGMLQDNRREVVGLNTRSNLFIEELSKKEKGVATLSAKVKEKDEDFAERIKPLVQEYKTLKSDLVTWEKSTENVRKLLERTKVECASIPTRLDLFRREQETRSAAVAELEASMSNKEDLVAVQFGFLLNELQLQQKQRGKWKKVTLEMHRLLKETKEQVATLTNNLDSCSSNLEKHQEQILSLEAMLRDTKDMAEQQLYTLKNEVARQTEHRDKVRASTSELSRLLGEAKEQVKNLTEKLAVSETQVQACTSTVESLEARITEKKALDASQIESVKAQLKIHLGQRAEWRENTNQMKQRLKEKQRLCTSLKTKLVLLKNLQSGDVRSSLSDDPDAASATGTTSGIAAHLEKINQMTSNLGKKTEAEESLATRMDNLENELRKQQEEEKKLSTSTQRLEKGLKQKEAQVENLVGQVSAIQMQSGAPFLDVDRMLGEQEQKQSNLSSKMESLAGQLLSL